jgi:hypothetical protein
MLTQQPLGYTHPETLQQLLNVLLVCLCCHTPFTAMVNPEVPLQSPAVTLLEPLSQIDKKSIVQLRAVCCSDSVVDIMIQGECEYLLTSFVAEIHDDTVGSGGVEPIFEEQPLEVVVVEHTLLTEKHTLQPNAFSVR